MKNLSIESSEGKRNISLVEENYIHRRIPSIRKKLCHKTYGGVKV
jgi:hypothetical protein